MCHVVGKAYILGTRCRDHGEPRNCLHSLPQVLIQFEQHKTALFEFLVGVSHSVLYRLSHFIFKDFICK